MRGKRGFFVFIFSFFCSAFCCGQKCDCEANFKWAKRTFEQNDAGFKLALDRKGKEAYEKHNDSFALRIKKATTKDDCAEVINDWLHFFRKGHLYAEAIYSSDATKNELPVHWQTINISESEIKNKTANAKDTSLEGIWATGVYTIGVVKQSDGYKGVVLSQTGSTDWKADQVKFEINNDKSGRYFMGDYSPVKFTGAKLITRNTLQLQYFFLQRVFPVFKEDTATVLYSKIVSAPNAFLQLLSNQTLLMRIPSFGGDQKPVIDSLLTHNDSLIKSTKNLIIDIRNNGGGNDDSYENIIPYLYTNPIRTIGMELYSTPLNNKRMSDYLSIKDLSEDSRRKVLEALKSLNDSLGQFVNLGDEKMSVFKRDSVYANPENIAIITNENDGSTAEQFLLDAKQSKKVKLFGRTTAGVLDVSNMYFAESPTKDIKLGYALSKSLRIPDNQIDGIGIQPDFYLDKSIADEQWIDYVKKILEQ